MEKHLRTAIVHGGTSAGQAVSAINAAYAEAALLRRGCKTFPAGYNRNMIENLYASTPGLVWGRVQGKGRGDGAFDFSAAGYPPSAEVPARGESFGIELVMTEKEHGNIKPVLDCDEMTEITAHNTLAGRRADCSEI